MASGLVGGTTGSPTINVDCGAPGRSVTSRTFFALSDGHILNAGRAFRPAAEVVRNGFLHGRDVEFSGNIKVSSLCPEIRGVVSLSHPEGSVFFTSSSRWKNRSIRMIAIENLAEVALRQWFAAAKFAPRYCAACRFSGARAPIPATRGCCKTSASRRTASGANSCKHVELRTRFGPRPRRTFKVLPMRAVSAANC